MTTAHTRLLSRGGEAGLSFGLVIEGVRECWVSDPQRAADGPLPWVPAVGHVAYAGLDVGDLTLTERCDWLDASVDAESLTVEVADVDDRDMATAVFGGRQPGRRTWMGTTTYVESADVTITVQSTAGWPAAGYLHIGRECIGYTGKTDTTFTGCTRAAASSLAVTHNMPAWEADAEQNALEVTDTPVALESRRAQLYVFVDDEASVGTVIWRGIVRGIRQQGAVGYAVEIAHISELLDQDAGTSLKEFHLRGFYFSTEREFYWLIAEYSNATEGGAKSRFCPIVITGYYPNLDALIGEMNRQLASSGGSWVDNAISPQTPINDDYAVFLTSGGGLGLRFRADSSTPKAVFVGVCDTPGLGAGMAGAGGSWRIVDENAADPIEPAGGHDLMLAIAGHVYSFLPRSSEPFPVAYTWVHGPDYHDAPEVGGIAYPANRIYNDGYFVDHGASGSSYWEHTVLHCEVIDSPNPDDMGRKWEVLGTASDYLTVGPSFVATGSLRRNHPLVALPGAPVTFRPMQSQIGRWDQWLRDRADRTIYESPWLPSTEFDWDQIERASLAAGARERTWKLHQALKVMDLVRPELQSLGLCWATVQTGKLGVRPILVANGSLHAVASIVEDGTSSGEPENAPPDPSVEWTRDGIVNVCLVRGGYDPIADEWTRLDSGALMPQSIEHYGRKELVIEPRHVESDSSAVSAETRAAIGRTLVHTHAWPYAIAYLPQCAGLELAAALCGEIVSLSHSLIVWQGRRGVANLRGQVVGRAVHWSPESGGSVDLTVRLSDWNAASYAPSARLAVSSPLSGARIALRTEKLYAPSAIETATPWLFDMQSFQVGDKVRIRRVDYNGLSEETGFTITRTDDSQAWVYLDPAPTLSLNTAGTRWVLEYDDWDDATNTGDPPQRMYAFIAGVSRTLGSARTPAFVWGA